MEDEEFEKYFETIEEIFSASDFEGSYGIFYDFPTDKRKAKLKEILEEIYQKGKDNKFKDIGYIDVDGYYPDNEEAKP